MSVETLKIPQEKVASQELIKFHRIIQSTGWTMLVQSILSATGLSIKSDFIEKSTLVSSHSLAKRLGHNTIGSFVCSPLEDSGLDLNWTEWFKKGSAFKIKTSYDLTGDYLVILKDYQDSVKLLGREPASSNELQFALLKMKNLDVGQKSPDENSLACQNVYLKKVTISYKNKFKKAVVDNKELIEHHNAELLHLRSKIKKDQGSERKTNYVAQLKLLQDKNDKKLMNAGLALKEEERLRRSIEHSLSNFKVRLNKANKSIRHKDAIIEQQNIGMDKLKVELSVYEHRLELIESCLEGDALKTLSNHRLTLYKRRLDTLQSSYESIGDDFVCNSLRYRGLIKKTNTLREIINAQGLLIKNQQKQLFKGESDLNNTTGGFLIVTSSLIATASGFASFLYAYI